MTAKIESISSKLEELKDKCLVVAFFENNLKLSNELAKFDKTINNVIGNAIKNKDFKAEENETKSFYVNNKNLRYVVVLGLGKEKKFNSKKLMDGVGELSRNVRSMNIDKFSLLVNSFNVKGLIFDNLLGKITIALKLSLYQYLDYKTKDLDKVKKIIQVNLIVDKSMLNNSKKIVDNSLILAEAVTRTRSLINTPPNVAIPVYVADYAKEISRKNKIKCTILDEKEIEKLGMNCYIAVGQASVNKPRLIIMEYIGKGNDKPIVLVGKGITYDTGGINTKPANYMATMKDDKAGACTVIHAIEACARLNLKVNVIGMAVMAENSVSGNAYKPDDILKSYSGITVEVIHSDAEGRMVLADALAYALKFKPKAVVDIATLTGASIIALGYLASPVMGTNQRLIDNLIKSGESSQDRLWQLPLWDEHEEIIKSDIADVKHLSADMDAGVIVGGVFLKQFVKDTAWAHIDIGATVMVKKDQGYKVKGATGFGVLLFLDFLKNYK